MSDPYRDESYSQIIQDNAYLKDRVNTLQDVLKWRKLLRSTLEFALILLSIVFAVGLICYASTYYPPPAVPPKPANGCYLRTDKRDFFVLFNPRGVEIGRFNDPAPAFDVAKKLNCPMVP